MFSTFLSLSFPFQKCIICLFGFGHDLNILSHSSAFLFYLKCSGNHPPRCFHELLYTTSPPNLRQLLMFSVFTVSPFLDIMQCTTFWFWHSSLSICICELPMFLQVSVHRFLFHCMHISRCLFIPSLRDIWVVSSFWKSWATMNTHRFSGEHKFSFHSSKYFSVKLLGCMGSIILNSKIFPKQL